LIGYLIHQLLDEKEAKPVNLRFIQIGWLPGIYVEDSRA